EKLLILMYKLHIELGHPGANKLYYTFKNYFKSKKIKLIVNKICSNCIKCLQNKNFKINHGELKNFLIAKYPLQKISSNLLGPLSNKEYLNGRKFFILTISDIFTRYTKLYVIEKIDTKTLINKFNLYLEELSQIPKILITDQGRQYT